MPPLSGSIGGTRVAGTRAVAHGFNRGNAKTPTPPPHSGRNNRAESDQRISDQRISDYRRLATTWSRYAFAFAMAAFSSTVRTLPLRMRIRPSQIVVVTELPE